MLIMSVELKKQSFNTGKKLYEISDGQRLEPEITLPDYCKEIKKLLKCTFSPGIHTVNLSGEKVTAKGTGVIRVAYLGEGDTVDAFEKSCDLVFSAQMKDVPPDAAITARQTVDFINCRVTGQRKLSVSVGVSTVFTCYCTDTESLVAEGEEKNIQSRVEKISCETFTGFYEKIFDMSETVVLGTENPSVAKIFCCDAGCNLESQKLSSGKLLIKGETVINISYLPENSDNKLHSIRHTMPISQIVDLKETADSADCDITLKLNQLTATVKSDSSGSNRLIELSLRVGAFVAVSEKKECSAVTDCYCTDYELETDYSFSKLLCPLRKISESRQQKGEIEFSDKVKQICVVRCLEINKNFRCDGDKLLIDCNSLLGILYIDEKGIPSYCEKNLDFDFSYSLVKDYNEPSVFLEIEPESVSFSLSSSEKAEVTLNYKVKGRVYDRFEKKVLKDVRLLSDKPKKDTGVALTVYFADEGESLWEIARSHNTTVELIKQENGLKDEETVHNGMLMLPCV